MGAIGIKEIASLFAKRTKLGNIEAEAFINSMFLVIRQGLEADRQVKIRGFGTFKVIDVDDRESVNVNTGERVMIKGHGKVTFTPDATMKELVNKPFALFSTVALNDGVVFDDPEADEPQPDDPTTQDESDATTASTYPADVADAATSDSDGVGDVASGMGETVSEVEALDSEIALGDAAMAVVHDTEPSEVAREDESTVAGSAASPEPEDDFGGLEHAMAEPEPEALVVEDIDVLPLRAASTEPLQAPATPHDVDGETCNANCNEAAKNTEVETETTDVDNGVGGTTDDDANETVGKRRGSRKALVLVAYCLVTLALMAASAYFGMLYGRQEATLAASSVAAEAKPVAVLEQKPQANVPEQEPQKTDTVEANPESVEDEALTDKAQPSDAGLQGQGESSMPNDADVAQMSANYGDKDIRVRTGAYSIVGLDRTVKVKEGESLKSISERLLGPGMTCYVEVFNGLNDDSNLKAGQIIRMPKLKLKKSLRKKTD